MIATSLLISLLALVGLGITTYIFRKKSANEQLVCVLGQACNYVTKSKYSSTLGIPNELLGTAYYMSIILLLNTTLLLHSEKQAVNIVLLIMAFSASAFSVYLTYIQFFVLKKICEYCLATNLINILILFTLVLNFK